MPSANEGKVTVPSVNKDPSWSLRTWPVTVELSGHEYEIPELPASDWLGALFGDHDIFGVFPGLLSSVDQDEVWDLVSIGAVNPEDLATLGLDIVETVSARRWWVALRLISVMEKSWQVLGAELIFRGVDATKISLSAWLDVALLIIMRNLESDKATMFGMRLEAAPPGFEGDEPEPEMDAGAFMSMAS